MNDPLCVVGWALQFHIRLGAGRSCLPFQPEVRIDVFHFVGGDEDAPTPKLTYRQLISGRSPGQGEAVVGGEVLEERLHKYSHCVQVTVFLGVQDQVELAG